MSHAACRNHCRRRSAARRAARVVPRRAPAPAGRMLPALALAAASLALGGCGWLGLGWGALTYPETAVGESANVATQDGFAYVTRGAAGIEVLEPASGRRHALALPDALASVDDIAIADGLLFALDAREPGALAVFSLADPRMPRLVAAPVPVEVGPFSGVSAAAGHVVVSGGTKSLTVRAYDALGALGAPLASADLGRGQPDALLAPDGRRAYVSVHDWGPQFSLAVLDIAAAPWRTVPRGRLPLASYGFTPGGAKPASFPIESALEGRTLAVAHAAGLLVADVGDPDAPRELALLELGFRPVNVELRDGIAAVVGGEPEPALAFVDLREPAMPQVLRHVALPAGSRPTGVALTATHAVIAAHAAGTLIVPR